MSNKMHMMDSVIGQFEATDYSKSEVKPTDYKDLDYTKYEPYKADYQTSPTVTPTEIKTFDYPKTDVMRNMGVLPVISDVRSDRCLLSEVPYLKPTQKKTKPGQETRVKEAYECLHDLVQRSAQDSSARKSQNAQQ